MGLTTALYTGLSGINVNQARIETIGNNIANINTVAFKSSRTMFQTQFSRTLSMGSAPSSTSGGTNPLQFGLGAIVGSTQRDFTQGSVEITGIPSQIAVEGSGFFITQRPSGQRAYTRDGAFSLNSENQLVTADGNAVLGFGIDQNFAVIPTLLTQLSIPLGTLSIARATGTAILDGDLSAAGTPATQGSVHTAQAFVNGGGAPADASVALSDLRSASNPGTPLFANGTTITVSRVTKGDRELPPQTFVVGTTGTTLGDFANWLEGRLGIQTTGGAPGSPGVTVENGTLVIRGNTGEQNALGFAENSFASDHTSAPLPFQISKTADANGSSVFTAFTVFDSLGNPVTVNVTFALENKPNSGPVWRYYLESPDNLGGTGVSPVSRGLGTGTVAFDTVGNFVSASQTEFSIDRTDTGAASPMTFSIDLSGIHGLSTRESSVILAEQDGVPPGILANYAIGNDGIITGVFTNGVTRSLGQVALAVFSNPDGLVSEPGNLYLVGPNSGTPAVTQPGQFGAGTLLSGSLELGNVDLSREFIGLITSSTGFQASSRVISVTSDLLDQLLLVVR